MSKLVQQHQSQLKVALFFGGKSAEHIISIQSARNVFQNLDTQKYEVFLIGIDQKGTWYQITDTSTFLKSTDQFLNFPQIGKPVMLISQDGSPQLLSIDKGERLSNIDVGFPILHGPYGEDGSFQGLLKCHNLPFVGSDVLSSALAMDKVFTKKLLLANNLPTAKFIEVSALEDSIHYYKKSHIVQGINKLGWPVFVKPANMGSSIGVHKVSDHNLLTQAMEKAFSYDHKVIVEEAILGREIEIAVLGHTNPKASTPGEIVPQKHDFYSYKAKYEDPQGALLKISDLKLPSSQIKELQTLAQQVFLLLECKGMARVDFFLQQNDKVLINEVNTIPGFTRISMYPKLWEASGLSYAKLLDQLLCIALQSSPLAKKK